MKRFYRVRVYRYTVSRRRAGIKFGVEIVSTGISLKRPDAYFKGRIVKDVRSDLDGHGEAVLMWANYASRVARGWNAVLLACELVEASLDIPPEILADLVDEHGWSELALLLRQSFAPDLVEWDPPGRPARVPDLPAGAPDHHTIIV